MSRNNSRISRLERRFVEENEALTRGLSSTGKKNLKHFETIREELKLTTNSIAEFLLVQLPALDENWKHVYVDAAFEHSDPRFAQVVNPHHYELKYYDFRCLMLVLDYCLGVLEFERDAVVKDFEISSVVKIRNTYEHNNPDLNIRDWKRDVNTIRVFRSKFQTLTDIASEIYNINELPSMNVEVEEYLDILQGIQDRVDVYSEVIAGLERQIEQQKYNDALQFEELEKRAKIDDMHDAELEQRRLVDDVHSLAIDYQKQIDEKHAELIAKNRQVIGELQGQIAEYEDAIKELEDLAEQKQHIDTYQSDELDKHREIDERHDSQIADLYTRVGSLQQSLAIERSTTRVAFAVIGVAVFAAIAAVLSTRKW